MFAKHLAIVLGASILSAVSASAQVQPEAYVVAAGGGWSNNFASGALAGGGGGIEILFSPYFGAAGETSLLSTAGGDLLMPISVDGRAHFVNGSATGMWAPFALAGYSRLTFFEAADHAAHFGIGADYRTSAKRAMRLEFRDIVRQTGVTSHYWTVRVGVTFR